MTYSLFIDDEREPPQSNWFVARSYDEVVQTIIKHGMPKFISFDHDLGEGKSGYDIANWIVNYCIDNDFVPSFDFYVHSQNPVGKENIEKLLEGFKKWCGIDP
jgi:hypothetical protein